MEAILQNSSTTTDRFFPNFQEYRWAFSDKPKYTCEFVKILPERSDIDLEKQLTYCAMKLSEDSLSEDWNSLEDEKWNDL